MNASTMTAPVPSARHIIGLVTGPSKAYNDVCLQSGGSLNPDVQWIREISAGNISAFEQLCRAYQHRLFGYLFRLLRQREHAEEVLNEVFLAIWQGAARFKGDASPSTWIFRIARNRAISRLSRTEEEGDTPENLELEDPNGNAEYDLVCKNLVHAGLRTLSREHREVVELTFFLGLSYKEISEVVDCPVNTVKTRMFHAKQQLRQSLERTISRG